MSEFLGWINEYQPLLQWLGVASIVMLVATPLVFPLVIINLPRDYFVRDQRDPAHEHRRHPAVWLTLTIVKNIFGALLILAGLAMLVLPGQGLLAILIGISIANFPGKFAIERWIVSKPAVANTLNSIRSRAGKEQLEIPQEK